MNSGRQDCPGFEPLIALDYQRLWGGDRARTGLTLAARRGGELLGAVSLIFGKQRGRLRDLAVRADARRCGIGTALIEAALDRFRQRGLHPSTGPVLAEALAQVKETDERYYEAELRRLKGELLLMQGDEAEAEESLHRAVEVARRQQAKSWELRATMGLCRLWQQQGRMDEARQMLAEIYGWFTEGFDTLDLKEARALLEELSRN
jgi:GNAT superfamily N-acetyltransferase